MSGVEGCKVVMVVGSTFQEVDAEKRFRADTFDSLFVTRLD